MSSMKYPYRDLGVPFDRNFRNDLNANFDDIEHDIRMIGGEAAQQALEAAEEANTQAIYAQTSGDYANDKGDYAAQQGDYAQTQGNFANEKGLYAQQQGDYAKAQGDYAKQVGDENKTRWLNPVATFADIATTYPNPQHGDTVMVTDDGENSGSVYRYENGQWNLTQKHNDLAIADVQNKIGILNKKTDTFVSVEEFGAVGDGIQDDYQAIQNALDYAGNNGIRKVVFQKRSYRITNILQVPSGVEIDGNGATILFDNVNNLVINPQDIRASWYGVFNVHGTVTSITTTITSYETVLNKEDISSLHLKKAYNYLGKWGVANATGFSVGDFILIKVPFRPNSINELLPVAEVLARIEYIDGNYLYTDYYSPYNWSGYTFSTTEDIITKVNPKKDVYIHDVIIKDLSTDVYRPPLGQTLGDGPNRAYHACGVGIYFAYNVRVENIVCEDMKFSGVTQRFTHSCYISNLEMKNPKSIGGGEGYATQNMNVMNLVVERVRAIGTPRHLVDISSGYFCKVRDCIAQSSVEAAFDLHGEGEHDIEFENCVGGLGMGNGLVYFNELGHNITVRKSRISLSAIGFYTNVTFENSEVMLYAYTATDKNGTTYPLYYCPQVKFENCEILLTDASGFTCKKRGQNIDSYFIANNCVFTERMNYKSPTFSVMDIKEYENVEITNCKLLDMKGFGVLGLRDNNRVFVHNNVLEDSTIFTDAPNQLVGFIDYTISNNYFTFTDLYNDKVLQSYDFVLRLNNFAIPSGFVKVMNNTVKSIQTTSPKKLYFIKVKETDNVNCNLDFVVSGNVLKTNIPDALGFKFELTNPYCRYTSTGNIVQGTITVDPIDALIEEPYKKSVLLQASAFKFAGTGSSTGYAKIGEFTIKSAGHVHFIFDWLNAHRTYPSAGRIVGSIYVQTIGVTPSASDVKLFNTKFELTDQTNGIKGSKFILVETLVSPTLHKYELYVQLGQSETFVFKPTLDYNANVRWSASLTLVSNLPTGTQFVGTDA